MVRAALYFEVCNCVLSSIAWSKCSNCTVNPLKYLEENQEIPFHYHCKTCLNQDQISLLMYMIQCTIWVWPGHFINWVRPTWPKQNMIRMTLMSQLTCYKHNAVTWLLIKSYFLIVMHRHTPHSYICIHFWP